MDLLDRYLNAVRQHLPKDQADDIVAEIADDLQSQADEREAMMHRALTRDEASDLLKAYGHPRVVAARYGKMQYLVGPELLPFYWYSIKIVLAIVIALELLGGFVAAITVDSHAFARSLGYVWESIFIVVGVVTVIFAIIERVPSTTSPLARIGITRWNPRTLPAPASDQVPRMTSFFDAFANAIFTCVLLGVGGYRANILELFLGPAHPQLPFHPTGAWLPLYLTLLVATFAITVSGVVTFVAPHRTALRRIFAIATNLMVIAGALLSVNRGPLFVPSESILNAFGTWCIYGGITICSFTVAFNAWRLIRTQSARLSSRLA